MKRKLAVFLVLFSFLAVVAAFAAENNFLPGAKSRTVPLVKQTVQLPPMVQEKALTARETISLPPVDTAKLLAEDEADRAKGKATRMGIHRSLPAVQADKWGVVSDGPDGFAVRLVIHSPGAFSIRPHFARFPEVGKAKVFVYGEDIATAEGPVVKPEVVETMDFWGPPMPGEYYHLIVVFSARPSSLAGSLPVIDSISHAYMDSLKLNMDKGFGDAGLCHNDAMCGSLDEQFNADGVARLVIETRAGSFLCSGALLNDFDDYNEVPWFLTAYHCGVTKATAPSTYYLFSYQTTGCNSGTLVSNWSRVDGALFIAAYRTSDYTLVRLAGDAPAGSTLCGWDGRERGLAAPVGGLIYGIHHPRGDYKRISYGEISNWIPYPYDDTNHITTLWTGWADRGSPLGNPGVTEGGSSGSPLFHSGAIIGQLHGGESYCFGASPAEPWDYYGRLSVSWSHGFSTYVASAKAGGVAGPWNGSWTSTRPVGHSGGLSASLSQSAAGVVAGTVSLTGLPCGDKFGINVSGKASKTSVSFNTAYFDCAGPAMVKFQQGKWSPLSNTEIKGKYSYTHTLDRSLNSSGTVTFQRPPLP